MRTTAQRSLPDDPASSARSRAVAPAQPIASPEAKLARAGALGAAVATVPVGLVALLVTDLGTALAAAAGAGLVAVLSIAALPLLRLGVAAVPELVVGAAMLALGLRMLLALVVFAVLSQLTAVPMPAFAAGLAAGLVTAIAAEMAATARDPRFFWVTTPTPSTHVTERQHA